MFSGFAMGNSVYLLYLIKENQLQNSDVDNQELIQETLQLYRKLLGLPTQSLQFANFHDDIPNPIHFVSNVYLWLNYLSLQVISVITFGSSQDNLPGLMEHALKSIMNPCSRGILWLEYVYRKR